jgi:DNA-binding NtrC family response regulator
LVTWGFPRILVLDDDPSFGRILIHIARQAEVSMAFFRSPDELQGKLGRWRFDAAVVDSDLGHTSGVDTVRYFERFLENLPVLLVSQSEIGLPPAAEWPASVRQFLFKSVGHQQILAAVVEIAKKGRILKWNR